jgi:hypothetical protein
MPCLGREWKEAGTEYFSAPLFDAHSGLLCSRPGMVPVRSYVTLYPSCIPRGVDPSLLADSFTYSYVYVVVSAC